MLVEYMVLFPVPGSFRADMVRKHHLHSKVSSGYNSLARNGCRKRLQVGQVA
jgi:hypothetical protein